MNEYSLSDLAAATGGNRNGSGFGDGDGALWIILLIALFGGFGNNRGWNGGGNGGGQGGGYPYPYGAGFVGGNELYPWLNNSQNINDGFRDQMLQTNAQGIQQGINALSTQLCNCCGDLQQALCNGFNGVNLGMLQGFSGVEQSANTRQVANMQQQFANQTAMMQGFNSIQGQLAQCLTKAFNKLKNAFSFDFEAVGTCAA